LARIAAAHPLQIVLAGKAHPHDEAGKEAIYRLHGLCRELAGRVACAFLPEYDMSLALSLVAGGDVWLKTPLHPLEASGPRGVTGARYAVLIRSILDGCGSEACAEGGTGWAIGGDVGSAVGESRAAAALYDKLEGAVLPLFYGDPARWRWMMQQAIG